MPFPHAHYSDVATALAMSRKGVACVQAYNLGFRMSDVNLSNRGEWSLALDQMKASNMFMQWLTGHLESIVGTCNRIILAHKRKEWSGFERYARVRLRDLLPLVEKYGLLSRSQLLQWKLLVVSPALYSVMYRCYKWRHPEISSH